MVFQESETVELKEVVVDDIRKEIIAFANCDGGKLYIGVREAGEVVKYRRDKVIVNGNVLHTTMKVLAEDCRYREIKYYADGDFKKWLEQEEPDANKDRYFLFSPKASESR